MTEIIKNIHKRGNSQRRGKKDLSNLTERNMTHFSYKILLPLRLTNYVKHSDHYSLSKVLCKAVQSTFFRLSGSVSKYDAYLYNEILMDSTDTDIFYTIFQTDSHRIVFHPSPSSLYRKSRLGVVTFKTALSIDMSLSPTFE